MRFVAISDVHLAHDDVPEPFTADKIPDGDVLIDAGDMTYRGREGDIINAANWRKMLRQRFKHVIIVAGNHDWLFQRSHYVAKKILQERGLIYLEDDAVTLEGDKAIPGFHPGPGRITVYGSPWQPEFNNWAFNLPRGEKLAARWKHIPEGIDILVTHGPPRGILDRVPRDGAFGWGEDVDAHFPTESVGCDDLARRVKEVRPRVHVFGHIHASYGRFETPSTVYLNASIMSEGYDPINLPHVFDLEPREKPDPKDSGEPEKAREP